MKYEVFNVKKCAAACAEIIIPGFVGLGKKFAESMCLTRQKSDKLSPRQGGENIKKSCSIKVDSIIPVLRAIETNNIEPLYRLAFN